MGFRRAPGVHHIIIGDTMETIYPIKHLSASSVGLYLQCPRKWKFRYIDRIYGATAVPLVYGIAFHKTAQSYIQSGHKGNLIKRWDSIWKETVAAKKPIAWDRKTYVSMLATGRRMFGSKAIIDSLNGITVLIDKKGRCFIEHYLKFYILGVDIPFVGYIDIITNERILADFKTAKNKTKWSKDDTWKQLQPFLYLAGAIATGLNVYTTAFRYYIYGKARGTAQEFLMERISRKQIEFALDQVRSVWRGIKAGAFPVCASYDYLCDPRYCEYWKRCGRLG